MYDSWYPKFANCIAFMAIKARLVQHRELCYNFIVYPHILSTCTTQSCVLLIGSRLFRPGDAMA